MYLVFSEGFGGLFILEFGVLEGDLGVFRWCGFWVEILGVCCGEVRVLLVLRVNFWIWRLGGECGYVLEFDSWIVNLG